MRVRALFRSVLVALSVVPGAAMAQSPAMVRADSAYQRHDWSTAASLYSAIVRGDSANGRAWFRLGASLTSQRRWQGAVDAYQHAVDLRFLPMVAELRLSSTYAQMQETPTAVAHFRKAATFGFLTSQIADDSALAPLRSLPEYAAIVKAAEDAYYPCHRQHDFDYWEGVFTVTPWDKPDTPSFGTVTNTRQYEGCVFLERWEATGGGRGMSMVFYDVNRQKWRMIWNDELNSSNDFEGEYRDGGMRFLGWFINSAGDKILASNVLMDASPEIVHHILSTSADSGKTWTVRSDTRWTRQR